MKILILAPHPLQGASFRYRIHSFLPYLEKENIQYVIRPFVSESFYKILYKKGHILKKIFYVLISTLKRLRDLFSLYQYDLLLIHLETTPFPVLWIEYAARYLHIPIVFDFDDAIFLRRENALHPIRDILRSHKKTPKMISLSSHVIVCNSYLRDFAKSHIKPDRISVIPTSLDIEKFKIEKKKNSVPVIGWIGSRTTFPYLESLLDIFPLLSRHYSFILKIIGAPKKIYLPNVQLIQKEWRLEEEIEDFHSIDIGLYPLFDSEWAKGKASFKAIQYMAARVPYVASNVGRNKEIIFDGVNGLLATHKKDWIDKITLLLNSLDLQKYISAEGKKTVETHFSIQKYAPIFIQILKQTIGSP